MFVNYSYIRTNKNQRKTHKHEPKLYPFVSYFLSKKSEISFTRDI
jgi:hypothetical protein